MVSIVFMEPKRFSIKESITSVLLALPLLVTGQNKSAVDYPFIYHYNVSQFCSHPKGYCTYPVV